MCSRVGGSGRSWLKKEAAAHATEPPRLWEEIRFCSQSLGELLKGSEMIGFEFLSNGWPVGNGWPCRSRGAAGGSYSIAGTEIMLLLIRVETGRMQMDSYFLS